MAQLVVAEAERGRGRALVEAVAAERILEQRPLIGRDRAAEVVGRADGAAGAGGAVDARPPASPLGGGAVRRRRAAIAGGAQGEWNGSNWISSIGRSGSSWR